MDLTKVVTEEKSLLSTNQSEVEKKNGSIISDEPTLNENNYNVAEPREQSQNGRGFMGGMMRTGFGNGVRPPQDETDFMVPNEPKIFGLVNTKQFLIFYNLFNVLLYILSIILFFVEPNQILDVDGNYFSFTPITLFTHINSTKNNRSDFNFTDLSLNFKIYLVLTVITILIHISLSVSLVVCKTGYSIRKLIYILPIPWVVICLFYNTWSSGGLFAFGSSIFPFVVLVMLSWHFWNYARFLDEKKEKELLLEMSEVQISTQ
ncbi:hypothetical protein HDU92_000430 [Lobulomyces angularis]|nr:hypothetical protein HDU92_000430 [Lobulomyces angularis]